MNRKLNTILFILGATLFNILVTVITFVLLVLLYVKFLMGLLPEANRSWPFTLIFLASLATSFVVYRFLLKFLLTKVDVEKYFDPLFVRKGLKKQN